MKQGDGFKLGNLYFPGCFCLFLSSRVISLTFPMTSSHSLNMLSVLIEGCEVWLKAVSEFMFPVAYHRWHARTPWEGKLLRKMHCVPWSLQTGFESRSRLLKHFKRWCMPDAMHTEAASVGSYAVVVFWAGPMEVPHQQWWGTWGFESSKNPTHKSVFV